MILELYYRVAALGRLRSTAPEYVIWRFVMSSSHFSSPREMGETYLVTST